MGKKDKKQTAPNGETLTKLALTMSLEEFEKEYKIKPPSRRTLRRAGYPKSHYYKLLTRKVIESNRNETNKFLDEIDSH